jgi:hypothetical protein
MSEICQEVVKVTTTGDAGSATGSGNTGVMSGFLLDIHLDFHASAPASTDVTIAFAERGGNVLAVANANTDALYTPRVKPVDNANSAITDAHDKFPLNGRLSVAVAGSNALTDAVTAYIRYVRP